MAITRRTNFDLNQAQVEQVQKSWALGLSILQQSYMGKLTVRRKKLPFTLLYSTEAFSQSSIVA